MKILTLIIFCFSLFFRIYQLDSIPAGLYWEEVALGYDALSIAETGADHHGNSWPIVAFESFGDWKPSLYFYVLVPFVKILGLNAWAVRLPAAISGLLIAAGTGFLIYLLFHQRLNPAVAKKLALLGYFLASVNPWLIQFSRAGWEITLATALIVWAVVFWLLGLERAKRKSAQTQKNVGWFVLSAVLLALSMYTQHSARLAAPLIGLWLLIWSSLQFGFKNFIQELPHVKLFKGWLFSVIIAALFAFLLVLPLLIRFGSSEITQRFAETSIFSDIEIIERSNEYRQLSDNSLISRIIYHRYVVFGSEILRNLFSHLSLDFLFLSGDSNPRHSTGFFGLFYHLDLIPLIFGLVYLLKHHRLILILMGGWILISLLPASIATGAPHALRILPGISAWLIVATLGVYYLFLILRQFKFKHLLFSSILLGFFGFYMLETIWFWRFYTAVYSKLAAQHWQYGYEEMVETAEKLRSENPQLPIYITREQGRPAMYYWFYTQTNPRLVQLAAPTVVKDQGEFLQWQNISFIDRVDQVVSDGQFILASSPRFAQQLSRTAQSELDSVEDPLGETIWQVGVY